MTQAPTERIRQAVAANPRKMTLQKDKGVRNLFR